MDSIARALEGLNKGWEGAKYVRIDGSTDGVDRRTAAHRFRDDPTIAVALLSITAAGKLDLCPKDAGPSHIRHRLFTICGAVIQSL